MRKSLAGLSLAAGLAASGIPTQFSSVPGPIVGAGLPGLISACIGLVALAKRRRRARLV
jgi:hypothetical protein